MIDRLLQIHLEPVAHAERRRRLFRAWMIGWFVAVGVGLAFVLIRFATGWASPWSFLLLTGATLAWTLIVWQRVRRIPLDFQSLARKIETENPNLHALLLTAVEQKPDAETRQLSYLQTRVIREALAEDRRSLWRQRAAEQRRFAQIGCLVALLFLSGILVTLYQAAPPRLATLSFQPGQHGVTVTPGDTSVEKGSSVVVLARFDGEVPTAATLVVRPANETEQRISLVKNLDDPVFGTSLPEVQSEFTYHIEYGNERTREFRVTTFEFPRLERADAKITYPDYTGLPEKTISDTRRVSAVEGSALEYTFHLNKLVKSATLVPVRSRQGNETDETNPPANSPPHAAGYNLLADTNRPNTYLANITLEQSGRYNLILIDDAGRTNKLPPLFVIEVLTNRVPDLKFTFPKGDQRVSALEEIAFAAEVSDDFGLKNYGLAYNLAGEETKFIELSRAAGPHEKRTFKYLLPLETLGVQPDQLLSYYLWADDVGPDGNIRRTTSDMFFAEVRPFEEIFREGQSQDGNQQEQQQQQGQNAADRLAELQKQIISATWNLQRRETGAKPSANFSVDAETVKASQENALEQVRTQMNRQEDPRTKVQLEMVEKEMKRAVDFLTTSANDNAPRVLASALSAEQAAYQALLRLATRETQVAQGQPGQSGPNNRGQRAQRQLDQLDLRQSRNRYETERQAALPQNEQQREQMQAFNRLKELAQRQQDVNERLRELQVALQAAQTEAEREELRQRLKRLQEEQQQMLADLDELRQRMERSEQSQMAEARQQLEQTRDLVQNTAEAMERGDVAQALSSGTRAQRDLQQMRDDLRRQNSSQFAEDMRNLRSQARELAQQQEQIGQQLEALNSNQRKTLTDSEERKELASQLDEQKQRMDELVRTATEITQKAEPVEPLLSRQLYETLRQAAQNDAKNLQDTSDDLLTQGRLRQIVYDRLREGRRAGRNSLEVSADLLREGFSSEANNLETRARQSINDLRSGLERAAESVLGDDTEALRLARSELEDLSRQLERELAEAQRGANTNRVGSGPGGAAERLASGSSTNSPSGDNGQQANASGERGGQQQAQNQLAQGRRQSGDQQNQSGDSSNDSSQPGSSGGDQGQVASNNSPERRSPDRLNDEASADASANQRSGGARGGGGSFLDQFGGNDGSPFLGGPITGPQYSQWTDRLRDVEEMLDLPELRSEVARIRDRAREIRQDYRRNVAEPRWDLVQMQIAAPLAELRTRIGEELARRQSKEALVPIDRDPVPTRYSELVRRYYEELGRSESATNPEAKPGSFD